MAKKRSKWTAEMRARAAEHGRRGNREGKRRGGQAGGLVSWYGKTPEEQAEVLARLKVAAKRRHYGKQSSERARAAQKARGKAAAWHPHTTSQARLLGEMGILGKRQLTPNEIAALLPKAAALPDPYGMPPEPRSGDYETTSEFLQAQNRWCAERTRRQYRARHGGGSPVQDDEDDE